MNKFSLLSAAVLALSAGAVSAADIVLSNNGSNFLGTTDNGGLFSGQGISGRGIGGEIGIGETLVMNLAASATIKSFSLGLLYDGPEFGDVNEKAQITFFNGASSLGAWTFTALDMASGAWTGLGTVSNVSPAKQPGGSGVWTVSGLNLANVTKIEFTALQGLCGTAGGACNNQSDFLVTNVTAVPEPGTYALLVAGLATVGFVARRRRQNAD